MEVMAAGSMCRRGVPDGMTVGTMNRGGVRRYDCSQYEQKKSTRWYDSSRGVIKGLTAGSMCRGGVKTLIMKDCLHQGVVTTVYIQ